MERNTAEQHIIRVDDWGRISVPTALRKALGIGRGAWVELQQRSDTTFEVRLLSARDSRINELMRGDYQSRSEDDPLTQELYALCDEIIDEVRHENYLKRMSAEVGGSHSG